MKTQKHSALVQGDDGLEIRHFASRADAFAAEASREVAPERRNGRSYTTGQVAKRIGVSQRTIIRRCDAGEIPYRDEGTAGQARRMISAETLRKIQVHGLRGLALMRLAGLCALAALLGLALAPAANAEDRPAPGHWVLLQICGGSMEPAVRKGELVFAEPVRMAEVAVGDVITFHDWRHGRLVSHRVVRREGQFFVTKGDANFDEDERRVSAVNLRYRLQIPPR